MVLNLSPSVSCSPCLETLLSAYTESLSVVSPAYKEESKLPATLVRVGTFFEKQGLRFSEIIVIDDGFTDRTVELAQEFIGNYAGLASVRSNARNSGKGFSVKHGMMKALSDWLLMCDADEATL